jgi:hypothetical protein
MLQLNPLPFCRYVWTDVTDVKKNTLTKMTDESVQEKDVNSAKEEDSEHSNMPDTL